MPTVKEISDALESAGLKAIEQNKFTQLNADEGFCRGACMDWVRRVLQGRFAYGYERTGNPKGQKREAQMRTIHSTLTGRVLGSTAQMEAELERRRAALAARASEIAAMSGDAQDRAAEAYNADTSVLNQDLRAYGARADQGDMAAGWSVAARELDADVARSRGRKTAARKRSFSGIEPTTGAPPKDLQTSDAVLTAVGRVIREMAPATAAIFTYKPASDIGHSIGVFRTPANTALFDPSYGLFGGPGVEPAIKGIEYLLNTVYPGSRRLEFTVFQQKT